jgi:hypothetical protein
MYSHHGNGGRYRTRTDDLFRVKEARYQLRQSPETDSHNRSVKPESGRTAQGHDLPKLRRHFVTRSVSVGLPKLHPIQSSSTQQCGQCGCGAVVAHHLAKVRVASSNLVIRSSGRLMVPTMVAWPRGEAAACKAVHTGSNPVATSTQSTQLNICTICYSTGGWRSGSALP